jgi:hypothetical protein
VIELPQAPEPGRKRNLRNRQRRIVDERARKVHAPRACHLNGRGTQVCRKQAPEVSITQPQFAGQRLDGCLVKPVVSNEPKRAGNNGRCS